MQVVPVEQPSGAQTPPSDEPDSLAALFQQEISAGRVSHEDPREPDDSAEDVELASEDEDTSGVPGQQEGVEDPDEGPEEDAPAPVRADTFSRVKANLVKREKELSQARSENRALKAEVRKLSEQARRSQDDGPADVMDAVRLTVARRMGVKADDPRVIDELGHIAQDLMLESIPEGALDDSTNADLRKAREERTRLRAEQERQRKIDERFAQLERERDQARADERSAKTKATVESRIQTNADKLAFLTAQTDVDPVTAIIEMADAAIAQGLVTIASPADAVKLIDRCASQLDAHYYEQAKRLAPRLPNGSPAGKQPQTRADAQAKRTPMKRTGTGSGGGGRGAPSERPQQEEVGEEDFAAFAAREKRRLLALEQKRRSRR